MVLMGAIAGGALVIGVVLPVSRDRPPPRMPPRSTPSRELARQVPPPEGGELPTLPVGEVGASVPPGMLRRIDLPDQQMPAAAALALLSNRSGTPIRVVGGLDRTVEIGGHGRTILEMMDDVLGQVHADRRRATIDGRDGYEVRVVGAR
jgi:hypothetical protein